MKRLTIVLTLALVAGCSQNPQPIAPQRSTAVQNTPEALEAIARYEFGQSRKPLIAVEAMVTDALASPKKARTLAGELAALLGSQCTRDGKIFVCRQLALIATAENVPAIAALLADPKTVDMARYALEPIEGPEVDQALLDALPHASGQAKAGIINSLGERRVLRAAGPLGPLATDPNPVIADAALAALVKIGR